jgi:DNA-binding CsgD family transcriptional regulator
LNRECTQIIENRQELRCVQGLFLLLWSDSIDRAGYARFEFDQFRQDDLFKVALLKFLVHGHSDREIASLNAITEATVRFHLKNARKKIGAVSRTHLAAKVLALGFVAL